MPTDTETALPKERTVKQKKAHAEKMREWRKIKNTPENQLRDRWCKAFDALEPSRQEEILKQEDDAKFLIKMMNRAIFAFRNGEPFEFDILFEECQDFIKKFPLISDYCPDGVADEITANIFAGLDLDHQWDDTVFFEYGKKTRLPDFEVYEFYRHLGLWIGTKDCQCEPDIREEILSVNRAREIKRQAMLARISEHNTATGRSSIVREI